MKHTVSLIRNNDFRRLYSKGKTFAAPTVAVYCRVNHAQRTLGRNRLGITVSAKTGNAVVRNRARRRIREAYRINEQKFKKGFDIVIVARIRAVSCEFSRLERDLLGIFSKLGIIMPYKND